jgi:RluA family pseudouridine synthase
MDVAYSHGWTIEHDGQKGKSCLSVPASALLFKPFMSVVTNIAAYKFATLSDLKTLRERLLGLCREWKLKGTILLSTEGINLFVAGDGKSIEKLMAELHSISGLEDLAPKYSENDHQPFSRMLVRIKKEIIAFGVEGIDPAKRTSPKLPAHTLKQWLDEGRAVTLLDTRNDYEVKLGTFHGAKVLDIENFKQFPDAVRAMPEGMKDEAIVMFCTGGIRCEKAGPFMEREGFQKIFQLEGGILKYFEEVGGAHYDGECFVFDQRVGVDPALHETASAQCHNCQAPLTEEEQADPRYVPSVSCPFCYRSDGEKMAERIAVRQRALDAALIPLPGSTPSDNLRPINIPESYHGAKALDALSGIFEHVGREEWERRCADGEVVDAAKAPVSPERIVKNGERLFSLQRGEVEPDVAINITLLHEDEAIIVLNKPTPLPVHPSGRFNRNTLQNFLRLTYNPGNPRPAHRLDANTTGLMVFSRTRHFAKLLQPQFAAGTVGKTYLVRAQGHPDADEFVCDAPISTEPSEAGLREVHDDGLTARTEFRVLERRTDGTALLEAKLFTGRTNQIRVHLWSLGMPVCGDASYLPNGKLGGTQTHAPGSEPLCLHSWKLEFNHPLTGERMSFETDKPNWA